MKRKRKNMAKRETAKTNNDKSFYKNFVIPCVIFLVGYYFSAHNGICYSDFTFVIVILFIVVFVVGIKCLIKSKINSYAIGWWTFCVSLASFFILNVIYTEKEEANYFMSQVEDVASEGYRSPASIFFQIDGQAIWLPVRNEISIKEKLKKESVIICGHYKRGLFSSVMIIDYQIN